MILHRTATNDDAIQLAKTMRQQDRDEVWAGGRQHPFEAINQSMQKSSMSLATLIGGELVAIWGFVPVLIAHGDGSAIVWCLTSESVERHRFSFWKASKEVLEAALKDFDYLFNIVDARYERSIRWLKRLGFVVHEPKRFGPENEKFCLIEKGEPKNEAIWRDVRGGWRNTQHDRNGRPGRVSPVVHGHTRIGRPVRPGGIRPKRSR